MKMQIARVALSLLAGAVSPGAGLVFKATPAQQVVNMLSEMKVKGRKAMDEEKKTYAKYAEWADDTSKDLALEIKAANSKIEELTAFIGKAESDVAQFGREISDLEAEVSTLEAEKKDAIEDRQVGKAEYMKVSVDYAESVDALQRAIQTLSAQNLDRPQAEALLQRMSTSVSGMPRVLAALQLQGGLSARRGDGAPEVAAYEFQSGNIVELLEGLLDKFKQELSDVEKAEANQAHAFAMADLHLANTIKRDNADRDEKVIAKGNTASELGNAKGEIAEVQADLAEDSKLKMDTETAFRVKTDLFEENQKVRAAEHEALAKAVEILSSPAVAGSYAKHVNANLAQLQNKGRAPAFLQIVRQRQSLRADALQKAASILHLRANTLKSGALAELAAAAAANPFAKVVGMIESLLEKLKTEAQSEADHQAWCDEQLQENKLKRNKKTAQVNKLQSEVDDLSAKIADMGANIATLTKEQADLTKGTKEATALRTEEKSKNTATIADATAGAEAVKQALAVLEEFYSAQAGSSFLQQEPEMKAYKGMQGGKKGVLGMLEVIAADFARLKADTETAEHAAASEYDTYMKEAEASKKQKHEIEVQMRLDKDQREFEKSQTNKDLKATTAELQDANAYFEELKPSCIEVHVNYEERVAGRKAEIEALKEAYTVMNQQSAE